MYEGYRACPMTNPSPSTNPEIDALLRDAAHGDVAAVRCLLERHRDRLRRMIAARLDRRLAPRLDPSDVVQETLSDAARRLPEYLRSRPLPFFAWLYRLAIDRLARTHRDHVASSVRGIGREERIDGPWHNEATAKRLVDRLAANDTTPGRRMAREERRVLLAGAIARMDEADRQVLALRYLDQLAFDEIAAVLDVGLSAAKMRHLRAVDRLRVVLEELGVEPSTSP
jgi:RNA polymerase sigma-70 factor (ECF subfamily)